MTALTEYWQRQPVQPVTWQPGSLMYDIWAEAFSWQLIMRFTVRDHNDFIDWRIPLPGSYRLEDYSDLLLLVHSLFQLMRSCAYPCRCIMELQMEPNHFLPQREQRWSSATSLLFAGCDLYNERVSTARDYRHHGDENWYRSIDIITSPAGLYDWVRYVFFLNHLLRRQVELWRQQMVAPLSGLEREQLAREVYDLIQQQYPSPEPLPDWPQLLLIQNHGHHLPEQTGWLLSPAPGLWFRLPVTCTLREASALLHRLVDWCQRQAISAPVYGVLQSVDDWQEDWRPQDLPAAQFSPEHAFSYEEMQVRLTGPWIKPFRMEALVDQLISNGRFRYVRSGQLQLHADPHLFWTPPPRKIRKGPVVLTCPWPVAWDVTVVEDLQTTIRVIFHRQLRRALRLLRGEYI